MTQTCACSPRTSGSSCVPRLCTTSSRSPRTPGARCTGWSAGRGCADVTSTRCIRPVGWSAAHERRPRLAAVGAAWEDGSMKTTTARIDLASRWLGGSVLAASDESFGFKENLLVPDDANFTPGRYDHRGEIVDGWETRRRRGEPGHDRPIIRLAAPATITAAHAAPS